MRLGERREKFPAQRYARRKAKLHQRLEALIADPWTDRHAQRLGREAGAVLCRFSLELRRTLGDAVPQADLEGRLAQCPGTNRLTDIWRQRLQRLVLWMVGP